MVSVSEFICDGKSFDNLPDAIKCIKQKLGKEKMLEIFDEEFDSLNFLNSDMLIVPGEMVSDLRFDVKMSTIVKTIDPELYEYAFNKWVETEEAQAEIRLDDIKEDIVDDEFIKIFGSSKIELR